MTPFCAPFPREHKNNMGNYIWPIDHSQAVRFESYVKDQKQLDRYPSLTTLICAGGISPTITFPKGLAQLFINVPNEAIEIPDTLTHLGIWCDDLATLPDIPDSLIALTCFTQSMYLTTDNTITRPLAYYATGSSLVVVYELHCIDHIREYQRARQPVLK